MPDHLDAGVEAKPIGAVLRDTAPGGALLLDPTKLRSEGWRITFAAVLAGIVVAFVESGMRALGASSRTLPWSYPAFEDIFGRAESDVAAAQAARAASLLKTAGLNFRIVELKAGYLNAVGVVVQDRARASLAVFVTYAAATPERTMHQKAEPARKAVEGRTSGS